MKHSPSATDCERQCELAESTSAPNFESRSRVNFYVHCMESQGFEDPGYEESVSESLRYELRGVKLDVVIAAAYPALRFAVAHRDQVDRT